MTPLQEYIQIMSFLLIAFVIYAIVITRFYKNLIERLSFIDRDYTDLPELYRPFSRTDYRNWSVLEIYLGAIFLLPWRLLGVFGLLIPCYGVIRIGSIGVPLKQEWPATRYRIVLAIVKFMTSGYMFFSGFWSIKVHRVRYSDFDTEYKQTEEDRVRLPAIIVSNHVSWYDTIFYVSKYMPSFLSKADVAKYPIYGPFTTALKSVYVNRDDREGKDQVSQQLLQRSVAINKGQVFPPIIIFPEGTTSNGRQLISFKKGAFEALVPIKISCLKYHDRRFNLSLDKIGLLGVAAISMVQLSNKLEWYEFEGVYNPAHLNLERVPAEERWVVYANRVKDIMSKCLQVPKSDAGFRHSTEFEKIWFKKQKAD